MSPSLLPQQTPHYCTVACVQAFLRSFGIEIKQDELVDKCPKAFRKGQFDKKGNPIDGTFDGDNLHEIENEFDVTLTTSNIIEPNTILFVRWENDPTKQHALLITNIENGVVHFLNPANGRSDHRMIHQLTEWAMRTLRISQN